MAILIQTTGMTDLHSYHSVRKTAMFTLAASSIQKRKPTSGQSTFCIERKYLRVALSTFGRMLKQSVGFEKTHMPYNQLDLHTHSIQKAILYSVNLTTRCGTIHLSCIHSEIIPSYRWKCSIHDLSHGISFSKWFETYEEVHKWLRASGWL